MCKAECDACSIAIPCGWIAAQLLGLDWFVCQETDHQHNKQNELSPEFTGSYDAAAAAPAGG